MKTKMQMTHAAVDRSFNCAFRRAVALVSLALLVGCSTPMDEPATYLMRGAVSGQNTRLDDTIRVGLGRVIVAPYLLASQGIVVETAPGEIRSAKQHRWAEPLDAGLRWLLRDEIANAYGGEIGGGLVDRQDWDYTIDINVAQLHGNMLGAAILEGSFVIRANEDPKAMREYRFSSSEPLAGEGYPALVAAEERLVTGLGVVIAEALREMVVVETGTAP